VIETASSRSLLRHHATQLYQSTKNLNLGAWFEEDAESGTGQLDLEVVDGNVDVAARHFDEDLCREDGPLMRVQQQTAVETAVPLVDLRVESPVVLPIKQVLGRHRRHRRRCHVASHTVSCKTLYNKLSQTELEEARAHKSTKNTTAIFL